MTRIDTITEGIAARIARFGLPCANGSQVILTEPWRPGESRMFYRLCRKHADELMEPLKTLWGTVSVSQESERSTPCDVPLVIALVPDEPHPWEGYL